MKFPAPNKIKTNRRCFCAFTSIEVDKEVLPGWLCQESLDSGGDFDLNTASMSSFCIGF